MSQKYKKIQCGNSSEVGALRHVLLKSPESAFLMPGNIEDQWHDLNYSEPPDYNKALKEYENFLRILKEYVPNISFLPENKHTGLDSIYVHDSTILTKNGVILANMGKTLRSGEPSAAGEFLEKEGVPVVGAITGKGTVEGGDVIVWDEHTLLVGLGYRTNEEGINQLRELTKKEFEELVIVDLPHWKGPDDVLHLMSLISPVDYGTAVVYSPLLPARFRKWLIDRSVKLIEVPDSEFLSMGCNVLALSPGRCLMIEGNPQTSQKLMEEGLEVLIYSGREISVKGAGGPTCLTRPLLRGA